MDNTQSFLNLPSTFQPLQIVAAVVLTTYTGIFVMVSNHFILKPKVQNFFLHSSISSQSLNQFLIDFLTNLSPLTFLFTTLLLLNSDAALSVMIYSDISWSGLLVAVLAFRGILQKEEESNWKLMLIKNIVFLIIIYVTIVGHYLSQLFMISLGICLFFVYALNLFIDANEDKFVQSMTLLFNYKSNLVTKNEYETTNNMVAPQHLAKHFPVNQSQIRTKMKTYEKQLGQIKLKTKAVVTEKLLKIALAIHLSKQKMQNKAKRDIKYYYGTFNGTVLQKSRRLILDKKTTHQDNEEETSNRDQAQNQPMNNQVIFYIFPVKIFETNKIISILFSLLINFGFGFLLSLTLYITQTLHYGQYFQILYGLLLLPLLPSISKQQFFNSMTLSSLWKYCLYGLLLAINCLLNTDFLFFTFRSNPVLNFQPIIQIISLILVTSTVLSTKSSEYRIIFIWFMTILINAILIFKFC